MRIYTRTGDDGTTSLYGGKRVSKDDMRIRAIGAVDEANSAIGVARSHCLDRKADMILSELQSDLFSVGALLANPLEGEKSDALSDDHIDFLERIIDENEAALPKLANFILPAGSGLASHLFYARAVVRRAEREAVALSNVTKINPMVVKYLNRLSDLLFVMARKANKDAGFKEFVWKGHADRRKNVQELL